MRVSGLKPDLSSPTPCGSQCWFRPNSYRVKACRAPITPIGYRGISPSPQVKVCALIIFGSSISNSTPSLFLPPPSYHQTDTNVNASLNNPTVSYCTCKKLLSNVWIIYIQPLCRRPASFSATPLSLCTVTASLGYAVQGGGSGATRHAPAPPGAGLLRYLFAYAGVKHCSSLTPLRSVREAPVHCLSRSSYLSTVV